MSDDLNEKSLEEICKKGLMLEGPVAIRPDRIYRYLYDLRRRECWYQTWMSFRYQWHNKAFWQYLWQDSTRKYYV